MLAAKAMQQLSDTQRGERFPVKDLSEYLPSTVGFTGVKRQTSDSIAYLLDSGRFSYESIGKALDDIIHNNGQENYAAAKRVELVLDDMLTNGYADVDGRPHGPNEAYIAEKSKIPGAEVTEAAPEADSDYFADLVENGYDAAHEQAQQRTAQETQQATQETEAERRKRESYKDVPGLRWKSVPEARVDELLRTGLAELDGQQGVGNDGEVPDAWQYSVSRTETIPYQEQIDAFYGGDLKTLGRNDDIYVSDAIQALRAFGIGDKPFFMLKSNMRKSTRTDGNNPSNSAHGIGESVVRSLPELIKAPALVIRSEGRVSIIPGTLVETKNEKAAPLLIGIDPNSSVDGMDAYEIKSIYGRENFANWLDLRANDSKIIVGDEKKVTALLRDVGKQYPKPVAYADDLTGWVLPQTQNDVKQKFSVTEDSQGRELSEAQQAYFRDSAVRDEDGRLMVMYHGTRAENGDFTVFDYSKAVKKGGLGLKALGKGNYFTSKQLNGTERFGSRVIEAYLNITNPFVYDGSAGDTVSLAEQVQKKTGTDTQGMSYDALQDVMRDLGYDGVIEYRRDGSLGIAVTFDSEQIKNVTNRNPTGDPDIRYSVSEGKTQDELLDFVTQFRKATEERLAPKESAKESAKEAVEDNAAAIRGDLDRLAELTRQSEEAQGIQRQTPEEIAESKVNARVGEEKPGFMDRLRHPGQTIRDAGEDLRQAGESVRDTGRYFYRKLVDSGEAVSRVRKQSGDRMSIENMGLVENARDALAKRISRLQNRCSEKSAIRGSPPTQNHPRRLTERKLPGVCFFHGSNFRCRRNSIGSYQKQPMQPSVSPTCASPPAYQPTG